MTVLTSTSQICGGLSLPALRCGMNPSVLPLAIFNLPVHNTVCLPFLSPLGHLQSVGFL